MTPEQLKDKIVEAVPEIMELKPLNGASHAEGTALLGFDRGPVGWVPGKSLDDQSDELKQLLFNLICK